MSHQDDLESNYKLASNEQPSNEIDQLIIQAATDALEDSANQNDEANDPEKSNVIKGRFRLRQWQTPVSIAAAALFTVSFIGTYDLWQFNEQDFAQDSLDYNLPEEKIPERKVQDKIQSEEELAAPPVSLSQQTDNNKDQNINALAIPENRQDALPLKKLRNRAQLSNNESLQAIVKSDLGSNEQITVTGSRVAQNNEVLTSQSAAEERTLSAFKLESINTLNDSQAEAETTSISKEAKAKINVQNIILIPNITQWLEKIAAHIEKDKIENAKAEIAILIKEHPLSSFTKQQRDRLDTINKKIHLATSNENKQ